MDLTSGRRRSQRLFLQIRVAVEGTLADTSAFREETQTVVVNAHGALVEMHTALDQGQIVTLHNVRSSEKIECTIKLVTPAGPGKFSTAFEFITPSPEFWHVSFPPDDWSARLTNLKKNS